MIKKTLKINGVERILILDKDETLAQVLREHLLLTGCKIGCGEGHCGACNVIMNGKVTRSCIYKMSRVPDNAEITTIEGVGTISDMHPIQVAWMAYGCAQCGFCSPGFISFWLYLCTRPRKRDFRKRAIFYSDVQPNFESYEKEDFCGRHGPLPDGRNERFRSAAE